MPANYKDLMKQKRHCANEFKNYTLLKTNSKVDKYNSSKVKRVLLNRDICWFHRSDPLKDKFKRCKRNLSSIIILFRA